MSNHGGVTQSRVRSTSGLRHFGMQLREPPNMQLVNGHLRPWHDHRAFGPWIPAIRHGTLRHERSIVSFVERQIVESLQLVSEQCWGPLELADHRYRVGV